MRFRTALLLALLIGAFAPVQTSAQTFDEDQLGAWYMYFWNTTVGDGPWGFQGDAQYRNWDLGGDLEQLLLRGGLTYRPENSKALLTFGYANITTGRFGPSDSTTGEDRTYFEALLPHKVARRLNLRHRFRFEQRWVEDQDFRTRYRYAIFADIALGADATIAPGDWYLAFYNEIFVNGQRGIGDGRMVEYFDRNRLYGAVGTVLRNGMKIQGGYMHQATDNVGKGQIQLSLHHNF